MSSAHRHHRLHPSSVVAQEDELDSARLHARRDVGTLATPREIRDARGRLWIVREKRLTRAWTAEHLASSTLARAARGWLVFEHGLRLVVVTPPPARWREWDDRALARLMARHARHRPARRRGTESGA
jgi:hypothetical protein